MAGFQHGPFIPLHPMDPYYQHGWLPANEAPAPVHELEPVEAPIPVYESEPEEDPEEDPEEVQPSDDDTDDEVIVHAFELDSDPEEGYPADSDDEIVDMDLGGGEVDDPSEPSPLPPYIPSAYEYGSSSGTHASPSALREIDGTLGTLVGRSNQQGVTQTEQGITQAEQGILIKDAGEEITELLGRVQYLEQFRHHTEETMEDMQIEISNTDVHSYGLSRRLTAMESEHRISIARAAGTDYVATDAARLAHHLARQFAHDPSTCRCPHCPKKGKAPQQ